MKKPIKTPGATKGENSEMSRVTFRLPEKLTKAIQQLAERDGRNFSDYARKVLRLHVEGSNGGS